jgi:hypothetical protein
MELVADGPCIPGDGFTFCPDATLCLDRDEVPGTTCEAVFTPVIEEVEAFFNADNSGLGVIIMGTDEDNNVIGFNLTVLDAAGAPIALNPDDPENIDPIYQDFIELNAENGSFIGELSGLLPEGIAVASVRVAVVDDTDLVSEPFEVAVSAPAQGAIGELCDSAQAFDRCPDGSACAPGIDGGEETRCTVTSAPVLDQLTALLGGDPAVLGLRGIGSDAEGNAIGFDLLLLDAAGEAVPVAVDGEGMPIVGEVTPLQVRFNEVARGDAGAFDGTAAVPLAVFVNCSAFGDAFFEACLDETGDFFGCAFATADAEAQCATDQSVRISAAATTVRVRIIDATGELSAPIDAPFGMPAELAEGAICLGASLGACPMGQFCLPGEGLSTCGVPVPECPAAWEVGDLNAGQTDTGWSFSGDHSDSTITAAGSCGGGGLVDVLSFTAPEAGTYGFIVTAHTDDPLIYARSFCGVPDPTLELACNDDFDALLSGIELALEAEEMVYIFVDSYQGGTPGAYTLEVLEGGLPDGGGEEEPF